MFEKKGYQSKSLGLALAFVGVQFNTALKNIISVLDIPAIIMMISCVLIFDFNNIKNTRIKKSGFIILLFELFLLGACLFSETKTSTLLSYQLFVLLFTVALFTNKNKDVFLYMPEYLYWISGFISVVVSFQATNGFTRLISSFEGTYKLWLNNGGDPVTTSRALVFNVILCLFLDRKQKIYKITSVVFLASDIIGVLAFANRSSLIVVFIFIVIWGVHYFKSHNNKLSKKLVIFPIVCFVVIYFFNSDFFSQKFFALINSGVLGVKTLFGYVSEDSSALTRVRILNDVKTVFWNEKWLLHCCFGLGYNFTYVDRPLLQMFYDFGIVGFLAYLFLLIIKPIGIILYYLKREKPKYIEITMMILFQVILDQFVTGLPYYHWLWISPIVLLYYYSYEKKEDKKV